jgi:small-conductance mechanosensitive channel
VTPDFTYSLAKSQGLSRVVILAAALLVVKVTLSIVLGYRDYFPPNFRADFLLGRESYFYGAYRWAFYAHILVGPVALLAGLALVSERFRRRWPAVHRALGKLQIALVTLVVAPSGAWMAWYAQSGGVAGLGFLLLAIATAGCAVMGWRSAAGRRFEEHRRWMWRCFLLLCSAVVVRLVGGLATVTGVDADWVYPLTAWVSWLGPLAAFEIAEAVDRRLPIAQRATTSGGMETYPRAEPGGTDAGQSFS